LRISTLKSRHRPVQRTDHPSEDLLDAVRQSLIEEEETDKHKKEAKWWRRLGRKEKSAEPEPSPPIVEIDLPAASSQLRWQRTKADNRT
jgi:hypothetical protein